MRNGMKRIFSSGLALIMVFGLLSAMPLGAFAQDTAGQSRLVSATVSPAPQGLAESDAENDPENTEDNPFAVEDGVLVNYTGEETDLVIPGDLGITAIGAEAFVQKGHLLQSVVIPEGVKRVAGFADCTDLKSVTLPESTAAIEANAFYGCRNLKSIVIPEKTTKIGDSAFCETGLSDIAIPDSVKTIGKNAFDHCYSLAAAALGSGITSIGAGAFFSCQRLENIVIPDSVKSLGAEAFYGCRKLKTVTLGNAVASIGKEAFFRCEALTAIAIPGSVKSIGMSAFSNCISLKTVTLGNGVASIGRQAFYFCDALSAISLPNSVKSIDMSAFYHCLALKTVSIGSGLETLGYWAFSNCTSLSSFAVNQSNPNFVSVSGILFNKDKSTLLRYPPKKSGTAYSVPATVTAIERGAMSGCENLKTITLGSTLKSIGISAFSGCKALTAMTIPNSVKSLGSDAFSACFSLKTATLGNAIPSIGESTFYGCGALVSVNIPASVKKIGDYAFYGCASLKNISIGRNVTSVGYDAFSGYTTIHCGVSSAAFVYAQTYNRSYVFFPIELSKSSAILAVGKTLKLTAYTEKYEPKITWSTSNSAVAAVSSGGTVTAKAAGTAKITAKTSDGKTAACTVTVLKTADSVMLNKTGITLGKGEAYTLSGTSLSGSAADQFQWTSSNSKAATVSAAGKITAVGTGTAVITAKTAKGSTAKCTVTVKAAPTAVSLNKTGLTLGKGETFTLKATPNSGAASGKNSWSSSNTKVAAVDANGKITAKASGTATITVKTFNGKTKNCKVTVKNAPSSVALNKTGLTLGKGETFTLKATPNSGAASGKNSWSSSNTKVAAVDANGKITAKAVGSATITVKTFNGKTKACKVTVKVAPTSVKLSNTKLTLNKGKTAVLKATLNPSGAASYAKSWTSGSSKIAKVDSAGKVTAVAKGTATITCKTFNGKTAKCVVTVK